MIISCQLAADRDRYLEKYAFPFCAKQADKYEKVAKIGQVLFLIVETEGNGQKIKRQILRQANQKGYKKNLPSFSSLSLGFSQAKFNKSSETIL